MNIYYQGSITCQLPIFSSFQHYQIKAMPRINNKLYGGKMPATSFTKLYPSMVAAYYTRAIPNNCVRARFHGNFGRPKTVKNGHIKAMPRIISKLYGGKILSTSFTKLYPSMVAAYYTRAIPNNCVRH